MVVGKLCNQPTLSSTGEDLREGLGVVGSSRANLVLVMWTAMLQEVRVSRKRGHTIQKNITTLLRFLFK